MKLALLLIAVLPLAMGGRLNERFLDMLSGYDVVGIAKQIINQAGCQETEQQCEQSLCPPIVNKLDFHVSFVTKIVCVAVCEEVQLLGKLLGSGTNELGVDPCAGSSSGSSGSMQ